MKKLLIASLLILNFFAPRQVYSQLFFSDTAYFNVQKGDYEVNFFVDPYDVPDTLLGGWIFLESWENAFPAEFVNGRLTLSHPSELLLEASRKYEFFGIFWDEFGGMHQTQRIQLQSPKVFISLTWKILDHRLITGAEILTDVEGLEINQETTRFATIPAYTDSILRTEFEGFKATTYDGRNFVGELPLSEIILPKRFIFFDTQLSDHEGRPRLWASKFSLYSGIPYNGLKIFQNIINEGATSAFWNESSSQTTEILDMSGRLIEKLDLVPGQQFWLPVGLPRGYYVLRNGIGARLLIQT